MNRLVLAVVSASLLAASCSGGGESSVEPAGSTIEATSSTAVTETTSGGTPRPSDCETESGEARESLDTVVQVLLYCGDPFDYEVQERIVPDDGRPLRAALTQLLLGVSPEEANSGLGSAFSAFTAGELEDVSVADGVATISLRSSFVTTNNFSTSALSDVVLTQIAGTVFLFREVSGIEIEVGGERWCGWEAGECAAVPAPFLRRDVFAPPACVDAWRSEAGSIQAPIECEDRVAAFEVTSAIG